MHLPPVTGDLGNRRLDLFDHEPSRRGIINLPQPGDDAECASIFAEQQIPKKAGAAERLFPVLGPVLFEGGGRLRNIQNAFHPIDLSQARRQVALKGQCLLGERVLCLAGNHDELLVPVFL